MVHATRKRHRKSGVLTRKKAHKEKDHKLDERLEETFPASDATAIY